MERKLKNTETTEKHQKVTEYYFRKDFVYTAPRMKYFITIHEKGKKERLDKHYLTMYLRETHSLVVEASPDSSITFLAFANPDTSISFSAFAKLKPKDELLLKDTQFDGSKVKSRISKRVLQENKAHQIFQKTNISYPLISTRKFFWKIWRALFSCNTRFEIHPFALLPTNWINVGVRVTLLVTKHSQTDCPENLLSS